MKQINILLLTFIFINIINAQNVGLGTNNPDPLAKIDISSTTSGALMPRMTTAQRNAISISPAVVPNGLLVFDTDEDLFYYWDESILPSGNWAVIVTNNDNGFIKNQNASDQAANFRINGTGQQNKVIATANNDWYLKGGDDHELRDVNQVNTIGIWGVQTPAEAGISLGSANSLIYGKSGNIGIGTTNPTSKLYIDRGADSDFYTYGASGASVFNAESTTGEVRVGAAYNRPGLFTSGDMNLLSGSTSNPINFGHGNNTSVQINNGIIRMETTKNSNSGLEWYFNSLSDRYGLAQVNGGNLAFYTSGNYAPSFFSFNLANASGTFDELIRISHNGRLGIGLANPDKKLHIAAGNDDGILIGNYNDKFGWDGTGTAPETSVRFAGYRDVVSNFTGAKIAAQRGNICCSGLSQKTDLVFSTQEGTATVSGDGNLTERLRLGSGGSFFNGPQYSNYNEDGNYLELPPSFCVIVPQGSTCPTGWDQRDVKWDTADSGNADYGKDGRIASDGGSSSSVVMRFCCRGTGW